MKLKFIAAILLLATLLTAFAGCGPEIAETSGSGTTTTGGNGDGNGGAAGDTGGNRPGNNTPEPIPDGYLELARDEKTNIQIVYPLNAPETIRVEVEAIASTINEIAGTDISVVHDSEARATDYEIRVGYTKHATADILAFTKEFSSFKEHDFVVTVRGKIVYIYGKTDASLKNALAYFQDKVLYTNVFYQYAGIKQDLEQIYIEKEVPDVKYTGADDNYFYFTLNAGTLNESYARVSFTGNKAWRIQTKVRDTDAFNDIGASQRMALIMGETPYNVVEKITVTEGDHITATASDGSYVEFYTEPFGLKFYTEEGKLAQHIKGLSTSAGGSSIQGDILPDEGIFGTGERFNSVNQRGEKIHMFTKDIWSQSNACYMVIPLLTFTRGSGVFLNIYEEMNLQLGTMGKTDKSDTWSSNIMGANIDCYIYTSDKMSDAIYGYSLLSGFATEPEEWTYGMIICRYSPDLSQKWSTDIGQTNAAYDGRGMGVYDTIAMMEAYDLPWTTILAEGWGPYTHSKTRQEDLKELCDYVHALGKKFMVYMRVAWIGTSQTGYLPTYNVTQTRPNGTIASNLPAAESNNPDTGGIADAAYPYLDITNPAAVEWYFGEYWDWLSNDIGVDGCKIDFCETVPEYYPLNYYDENQPTSGSHHWLPTAFCAMFGEMISSKPDSGMNFTRGGGIGSQRAPYMWAGDQFRAYDCVKYQLIACLTSGMSGVPFMSYDMSGYQYGSASQNPYYEGQVFVRGLQFTAFTINMQQHGKVRQAFDFTHGQIKRVYVNDKWENATLKDEDGNVIYATDENGEKIPLKDSFGVVQTDKDGNILYQPEYDYLIKPGEMSYITDIYRGYVKLHEYLTPYIKEYSADACETGMPVMRPLALIWQSDKNTYDIDDEYMFGDAFLVAPVLDEYYKRDIYLPEGEWLDLSTGETHVVGAEGKMLTDYTVRLQDLPVFYNKNTTSETAEELLPGLLEIFDYINSIDCSEFYRITGTQP